MTTKAILAKTVRGVGVVIACLGACAAQASGSDARVNGDMVTNVSGSAASPPESEQLKISGDVEEGNLQGTFERIVAPDSRRFVEVINLKVLRTGSGFDGRHAWSTDASGASHYLNSDFARKLAHSEAWVRSHLGDAESMSSMRATRVGNDPEVGADIWRLTPGDGAPVELWYDSRTGRLKQAILQYSENRIIHHFADYREISPGRFLPFNQRDEDPEDQSDVSYHVRTVTAAGRVSSFAPAPPPNDTQILGGSSTIIPFQDDQRHRIFIPVYLNGKGPFTFELDSGGHFILTAATASALDLKAQGAFASTGAGTEIRHASYSLVTELRLGGAVVTNQTAKILPLSHNNRGKLPPRAGILGLEFFERFIVSIDHRAKTVTLRLISDHQESYPGNALPLTFDEDAPLTLGSYDGAAGEIMLDIGNAGPTIVEHYWAASHGLTQKLANGAPSGPRTLSQGTIALGPFKLKGEAVAYFGQVARGSENTHSVAAIVGEPLLSRFNATYDYGRQKVWLEPLPETLPVSIPKQ